MADRLAEFLTRNARWLGAGALLTFLSSFGQTFFISIFAGHIRADFGLSHGDWGLIYSVGTTASAAVMIWSGGLTDRWRARHLGIAVLAMLALACLAMSVNIYAVLLPLVIFALRLTGQGMTSHIAIVAMARWFVGSRGKALSIATLGFAVGEAALPILFVALFAFVDWRVLWVLAGLIALAGIPVLSGLLRAERTPQSMAETDRSVGMNGQSWTRSQALRHPLFWFTMPALLGPAAFNTAFFFQQVQFAASKGWSHIALVSLFPIYTAIGVIAMVVSGAALDRWGTARLMPYYQLPLVIAFLIFATAQSLTHAAVGMVFLALTTGANSTVPNAFWAEFYGTRSIGAIKAMAAAVMVLGSAIGPGLTGVLIDAGVPLATQYVGVAVYFLWASGMLWIGIARARPSLPATA